MNSEAELADTLVSRLHVLRSSAQQFLTGRPISNPSDRQTLDTLVQVLTGEPYKPGSNPPDPDLLEKMQRQSLVFTSVSNVLKTRHDTAKNSISNVR